MPPFIAQKLPVTEIDWKQHAPLLGRANRALAKYDGVLYGVLNPEILLSPLATREAVLSSRIEGTQASFDDVLKFEAGERTSEPEKENDIYEILNYRHALILAEKELKKKPFHLNLLLRLHDVLLDSVRGRDKARGRVRTTQNWIGHQGCTIEQAAFVPPSPFDLDDLISNWERYYHAEEGDPLVQLAIVHAQFEIIHPFLDGNGRLGRILIPLFLHEKRVLSRPMFYLSEYLEGNRDAYVTSLRALGQPGSWNQWITFFLTAVEAQAEQNTLKARAILDLYAELKLKVTEITRSQYGVHLLDFIFRRPVFQQAALAKDPNMPSAPMTHHMVTQLKNKGMLKVIRQGSGRRSSVFAFPALLNLCEGKTVF